MKYIFAAITFLVVIFTAGLVGGWMRDELAKIRMNRREAFDIASIERKARIPIVKIEIEDDQYASSEKVLPSPFYMSIAEITYEQYCEIMKREIDVEDILKEDYPVTYVEWNDAVKFCRRLTISERAMRRIPSWLEYRLPYHYEWKLCAPMGHTGNVEKENIDAWLKREVWCGEFGLTITQRVCKKEPNCYGLYDMYGNVCEWCYDGPDIDHEDYYNVRDCKYLAGGWSSSKKEDILKRHMVLSDPDCAYGSIGFRISLAPISERKW